MNQHAAGEGHAVTIKRFKEKFKRAQVKDGLDEMEEVREVHKMEGNEESVQGMKWK